MTTPVIEDRLSHVRRQMDAELEWVAPLWIPRSAWAAIPDPTDVHRPLGFVPPRWETGLLVTPICPELICELTNHLEIPDLDLVLEGMWLHAEWHGAVDDDFVPDPAAAEVEVMTLHRNEHPASLEAIGDLHQLLFGDRGQWGA